MVTARSQGQPPDSVSSRREVLSWAFYDWANSAFATTVMAGFFPLFFTAYWAADSEVTETGWKLGLVNFWVGLAVAVSAPFLGAIADRCGLRKRMLFAFTALGVIMTGALYFVEQGLWLQASLLYAFAFIGFESSMTFYDSLLVGISSPGKRDRVSALGYSAGYLGGGLLFLVNVLMFLNPETFGLRDGTHAIKVSFFMVAIWWAIFSIPLFLWVKEDRPDKRPGVGKALKDAVRRLADTAREIRKLRTVAFFLCGYWLYIDGVDTIIRMAVYYGKTLELPDSVLITSLLITQFVGFPATLVFGSLGERIGTKRGIYIGLVIYSLVTLWGYRIQEAWEFYVLAIMIGLVQGAVQALSRSFFSRIIPAARSAQFFGFYNMLGKFAAVIGPILMGAVGKITGDPRTSILSVLILFIGGGAFLFFVDEDRGRREAADFHDRQDSPPESAG